MPKPDLSAADQCVMCGMCQPHCPTYHVAQIESESPRGRLSLILGLSQDQLSLDQSVTQHLSHCTGCGACEVMCPSRVSFLDLIDQSKSLFPQKSLVTKSLLALIRTPGRYRWLSSLLKNKTLGNILRLFGLLDKSSKQLQIVAKQQISQRQISDYYPAIGNIKGNVALFTGCITQLFDKTTLLDTILLLTHCGYNVHIPQQQVCCGAMHQHNGEPDTAASLIDQNQQAFQSKTIDSVIFTSTGCGAQLNTYLDNINVCDIMQFINKNNLLDQLSLAPIQAQVLIHEPCSQRNQLKLPDFTPLVSQIPGLTHSALFENQFCCGAGGINMLTVPVSANLLRAKKIEHIQNQSADFVVTTNYGCALHLAAGIDNLSQNKQTEFCHPVSLLVRSASLQ